MAVGWIDRLQLGRGDAPIGEKAYEPASLGVLADDEVGQEYDSDPEQCGVAQARAVVQLQPGRIGIRSSSPFLLKGQTRPPP